MYKASGNIAIRDFTIDDVARKVQWINDPENNRYLHYDIPLSIEKTRKWFYGKDNSTRADCVIEYDGVPVGLIGLLAIDRNSRKAEYYTSMGETAYKRKGVASAATALILDYAFVDLALNKVYLNVDAENLAACALYEKAGFTCEGLFRQELLFRGRLVDRKRYAMLKDEWERRRAEHGKR